MRVYLSLICFSEIIIFDYTFFISSKIDFFLPILSIFIYLSCSQSFKLKLPGEDDELEWLFFYAGF